MAAQLITEPKRSAPGAGATATLSRPAPAQHPIAIAAVRCAAKYARAAGMTQPSEIRAFANKSVKEAWRRLQQARGAKGAALGPALIRETLAVAAERVARLTPVAVSAPPELHHRMPAQPLGELPRLTSVQWWNKAMRVWTQSIASVLTQTLRSIVAFIR